MKKILLSLAACALGAMSMNATGYVVFDISDPGTWTGGAEGWKSEVKFNDGANVFAIETNKATSTTDLKSPADNTNSWRVYKNSTVTISCATVKMDKAVIIYDDYVSGDNTYYSECGLSDGWDGSLEGVTYTLTSAGLNSLTLTANIQQVRIKKVTVYAGAGDDVILPDFPENIVYKNSFTSSIDDWTKQNDESLSDFNGWKINNSSSAPKCAICNSYYQGAAHKADSWLMKTFDLSARKDCKMTVSQAFGYDFPSSQIADYTVNVREVGTDAWDTLTLTNFPEKGSGNWTKFAENELDLSEYDGLKVEIGFRYRNDGSKSGAWELKDFVLYGNKTNAVEGIAVDNSADAAPVYYNLQGVRVNNPENGIFIVVKGNKASKVAF